jgi:hypothetical protein
MGSATPDQGVQACVARYGCGLLVRAHAQEQDPTDGVCAVEWL